MHVESKVILDLQDLFAMADLGFPKGAPKPNRKVPVELRLSAQAT